MINYEEAKYIYKPISITEAWKSPRQSLVSLKLDDQLLSLAECGYTSCSARYINGLLPSMAHSNQRKKVLDQLNALVLTFIRDNSQLKVYDYIHYTDGQYRWAYTSEYVRYFLSAGIILPSNRGYSEFHDHIST